jgi:nucleoside phosphorylase
MIAARAAQRAQETPRLRALSDAVSSRNRESSLVTSVYRFLPQRPKMARPLRCDDYTVGWVCALPIELAAAMAILDHTHTTPPYDCRDTNLYACGRVGEHNVVIASLPTGQAGTNSAAAVAVQMKSTFSSTRFSLMVGIGGGVPSKEADVRLGDVVVSVPHKTDSGVVQYDAGKATVSGFERTGALNAPPAVLLSAVGTVEAHRKRGQSMLLRYLSKFNRQSGFSREEAGSDTLYKAEYKHVGPDATCGNCSTEHVVAREERSEGVVVHCGTIASGNQVIKDAAVRDKLSAQLGGVLCFEMEAAGLMNSFPCLVVRGVCDYADSHKNDKWQSYAASTAAAYAKEVLSVVPQAVEAVVVEAPALKRTIRQSVSKRHYDGDSTYRSKKRARSLHSRDAFNEPEYDEDNRASSEDSEDISSEDGDSGFSKNENGISDDNESVSSEDDEDGSSEDDEDGSSEDDESGSSEDDESVDQW